MTDKLAAAIKMLREVRAKASPGIWARWMVTTEPQECPDGKMRPLAHGAAPPHEIIPPTRGKTVEGIDKAFEDGNFIALSANVWNQLMDVVERTYYYQRDGTHDASNEDYLRMLEALSALAAKIGEGK